MVTERVGQKGPEGHVSLKPPNEPGAPTAAEESVVAVVREAPLNVRYPEFGAVGDNSTDDTAALRSALTAAAVPGGQVYMPAATYRHTGTLTLPKGISVIGDRQDGQEVTAGGTRLQYTGSGTAIQWPDDNTGSYTQRGAVTLRNLAIYSSTAARLLYVPNGAITSTIDNVYLEPSAAASKAVRIRGFIQDWSVNNLRIECGGNAAYGLYLDGEAGSASVSPDEQRVDDCRFNYVYVSGATEANFWLRLKNSNNVIWTLPRSTFSRKHGFVLVGAGVCHTFISPNFESNGYLNGATYVAPTTGAITASAATLTVASATGLTNGTTVCVAGAGAAGADLVTTISSGGGTTTLTLAATASTTVSGAEVTTALYSDFYMGADPGAAGTGVGSLGGPGYGHTIIAPLWGTSGTLFGNKLRYAADFSGTYGNHVLGGLTYSGRPVYDPLHQTTFPGWDVESATSIVAARPGRGFRQPTLPTHWADPDSTELTARRQGKTVTLRGTVQASSGATSTVMTLPADMRPSRTVTLIIGGLVSAQVAQVAIQVSTSGVVTSNQSGDGTVLYLDGVTFRLD